MSVQKCPARNYDFYHILEKKSSIWEQKKKKLCYITDNCHRIGRKWWWAPFLNAGNKKKETLKTRKQRQKRKAIVVSLKRKFPYFKKGDCITYTHTTHIQPSTVRKYTLRIHKCQRLRKNLAMLTWARKGEESGLRGIYASKSLKSGRFSPSHLTLCLLLKKGEYSFLLGVVASRCTCAIRCVCVCWGEKTYRARKLMRSGVNKTMRKKSFALSF